MQIDVAPGYLENRVKPDEPGASWPDGRDWYAMYQLGIREAMGHVVVNTNTAMTYTVVWRCVNYIAATIASLCWHVYQKSDDGRSRLPIEDNIAWTLELQANPEMSALDWRQVMLRDALLWGNGYAEIERNGAGRPLWLWRIDPGRVWVERDERGRLYYAVRTPDGGPDAYLDPVNVFHLKGLSPDGVVGYSPIAVCRKAIELGLTQQNYGAQFFRRGPSPGGFLKVAGAMKEEERKSMGRSFSENYGGSANAGKVPVLSGGMEFVPFNMPNKDAQWIEGQNFQAEEICRIYGVPPHKAGVMTHSTFGNIEHQAIEAVQDCLLPWCRRLETEADIKLYGPVTRGKRFTKLDLQTLLRGDSATQTNNLARQVTSGLRTVNEGRDELDLNPVEGGDTPLIQGAMTPLDKILNPPEPPAPPARPGGNEPPPEPDEPPQPTDLMPEEIRNTFGTLLTEAYSRLLRVEADKARRAHNRGELGRHATVYYAQGRGHVENVIRPVVAGLLLATGKANVVNADDLTADLAADHARQSQSDLAEWEYAGETGSWDDRPERQAAQHLDRVWEEIR